MAAAGSVILFVLFLAAAAIIGLYLLAYIARCVLIVVEATAAGVDRVTWPEEPIVDWVGKSMGLMGLTVLVLAPVGILAAALEWVWLPGHAALRTFLLAGPGLWLLFPIGVISSLSAGSRLVFFRPVIVSRMLRLLPSTLQFYLASAVVAALALGPWYGAVFGQRLLVLIVAAPLSAMMVLIYARLLGLLAWKIAQLGPLPVDAKAGRCRPGWPASSDAELVPPHIPRPAPRAAPETEPAPGSYIPQSPTGLLELENLVPYKLAGDKGPTKPKQEEQPHKRLRPLDPEEEDAQKPYEMADPPAPNPPLSVEQLLSTLPRSYAAQSAKQKGVSQGLSLGGVIAFPFYETSLGAFVWLSPGSGLFGLLAMQLVSSVPR